MMEREQKEMGQLLRKAVRPIDAGTDAEPARDLWPEMLKRLDPGRTEIPWFDWVLLGGVAMLVMLSPRVIPLLVYYL